jgi:hypothetical protein
MLKHILDHKIWTEVHEETISDLGPKSQLHDFSRFETVIATSIIFFYIEKTY